MRGSVMNDGKMARDVRGCWCDGGAAAAADVRADARPATRAKGRLPAADGADAARERLTSADVRRVLRGAWR